MDRAQNMTVWPFDKRTFRRFIALYVSPVLPAFSPIFRDFPVMDIIRAWLGG